MGLKTTVREWFKTGLKPTQTQFWSLFDSIRWNDEKIAITDITNIEEILNDKADREAFDAHKTDPNAHPELLVKSRVIPAGSFVVFKVAPNVLNELEVGDIACGNLSDGTFIPFGKYLGGDPQNINNWLTNPLTF